MAPHVPARCSRKGKQAHTGCRAKLTALTDVNQTRSAAAHRVRSASYSSSERVTSVRAPEQPGAAARLRHTCRAAARHSLWPAGHIQKAFPHCTGLCWSVKSGLVGMGSGRRHPQPAPQRRSSQAELSTLQQHCVLVKCRLAGATECTHVQKQSSQGPGNLARLTRLRQQHRLL